MFFKDSFKGVLKNTFLSFSQILVVDLGDARSFQKQSLKKPHNKVRINTCDVIMERRIFVFSLASGGFSLCVRAVKGRGPSRWAAPRSLLDSKKQDASHEQQTRLPEGSWQD